MATGPGNDILSATTSLTFLFSLFQAGFNYIIDTYLWGAASALSINTVVRSAFGAGKPLFLVILLLRSAGSRASFAGFPLFAGQMYRKLSTPGASSLLGGLAVLFIPVPFLLMKYGKKIRGMSKNAYVATHLFFRSLLSRR